MKVCRWKSKPAIVCFVTVLTCLGIVFYRTFNLTVVGGKHEAVFIRGAHQQPQTETEPPLPSAEDTAEVINMQQPNNSLETKMTTESQTYIPSRLIVHLDLKGAALRSDQFRAFFYYFSKLGATGVLIEWEDMFPYDGELKLVRNGDAYSVEDVKRILRDAADFGLQVIPLVQTLGHLEWILKVPEFDSLRENADYPQAICVSNSRAIELVLDLVRQVMTLHKDAEFVHIGCDEVYQYGECNRCAEKLKDETLTREELVIRHISKVAKFVVENYHKKVLVWHDFLANVPKQTIDKYDLKTIIEPVVWNYAEDIQAYMSPGTWDLFSTFADYIWGASAFKGADGPTRFHSNVPHYLKNHISWVKEMSMAHRKFKEFRGLVFSGWQRYDHLSGLCELLPVGIPSLTVNMLTVRNSGHNAEVDHRSLTMMRCSGGSDILNELYGCSFPGSGVYNAIQTLYRTIQEVEDNLFKMHSLQGWLSVYSLDNNISSPWVLKSVLPEIENYRWQLKAVSDSLEKVMSELYFPNTVDEFLATYVDPLRLKLEHMLRKGMELMAQKNFPVRPFPIQRNLS